MNPTFELHIAELNGYLNSLRRLCGNCFFFGAQAYAAEQDIDAFAKSLVDSWSENGDYCYEGRSIIEWDELSEAIESMILHGILDRKTMPNDTARAYVSKMLVEDINEYYGLASTSLDDNGVFHPLIQGPVYKLNISGRSQEKTLYYLVKIGRYYVFTHFRRITNNKM